MGKTLMSLLRDEDGLSSVEIALLVALIALMALSAWLSSGDTGTDRIMALDNSVSCSA
jgi:Flp pilus assembly pilin Flp